MRVESFGVVFVVIALAPLSAHADTSPSLVVSVGTDLGRSDRPSHTGTMLGFGVDADLRVGPFTAGGSIAYDDDAPLSGSTPVHAGTFAARAGVDVPYAETAPRGDGRVIRFDAIGALEAGLHAYSVDGQHDEFLGGTTTYRGNDPSLHFIGVRLGTSMMFHHPGSQSGMILELELVGRRDLGNADINYESTTCGGFLVNADQCTAPTPDTTTVGGSELSVMTSIGFVFGGA
jgi:hypothetical protein